MASTTVLMHRLPTTKSTHFSSLPYLPPHFSAPVFSTSFKHLSGKHYADQHRSEREFQVGDWVYTVYLKLHPYAQQTVARRSNRKLSAKYYGPYKVVQKVGKVAYKLELPAASQIHPTFHVSLLKKKIGEKEVPLYDLPKHYTGVEDLTQPLQVLSARLVNKKGRARTQWLIHWEDSNPEKATWEDSEEIQAKFPDFQPWGQGYFKGKGCYKEKGTQLNWRKKKKRNPRNRDQP